MIDRTLLILIIYLWKNVICQDADDVVGTPLLTKLHFARAKAMHDLAIAKAKTHIHSPLLLQANPGYFAELENAEITTKVDPQFEHPHISSYEHSNGQGHDQSQSMYSSHYPHTNYGLTLATPSRINKIENPVRNYEIIPQNSKLDNGKYNVKSNDGQNWHPESRFSQNAPETKNPIVNQYTFINGNKNSMTVENTTNSSIKQYNPTDSIDIVSSKESHRGIEKNQNYGNLKSTPQLVQQNFNNKEPENRNEERLFKQLKTNYEEQDLNQEDGADTQNFNNKMLRTEVDGKNVLVANKNSSDTPAEGSKSITESGQSLTENFENPTNESATIRKDFANSGITYNYYGNQYPEHEDGEETRRNKFRSEQFSKEDAHSSVGTDSSLRNFNSKPSEKDMLIPNEFNLNDRRLDDKSQNLSKFVHFPPYSENLENIWNPGNAASISEYSLPEQHTKHKNTKENGQNSFSFKEDPSYNPHNAAGSNQTPPSENVLDLNSKVSFNIEGGQENDDFGQLYDGFVRNHSNISNLNQPEHEPLHIDIELHPSLENPNNMQYNHENNRNMQTKEEKVYADDVFISNLDEATEILRLKPHTQQEFLYDYDKNSKLEEGTLVDAMERVQNSKIFVPLDSNSQYRKPEIDDNSKLPLNPYRNDGQKFMPESQEYLSIPNDGNRQSLKQNLQSLNREGMIVNLKQDNEYVPSINSEKPQNLENAHFESEKQTFEHYERPISKSKTHDESKSEETGPNVRLENDRGNYYTPEVDEQVINYDKRTKLDEAKMADVMEQVQSSKTFIPPHTFYSNPQYGKPEIDDNLKLHPRLPILSPFANDGQKFAPERHEHLTIPNDANRQSLDREGTIVDLKQNKEYMPSINSEKPQNLENVHFESEKQTFGHYERPISKANTHDESKLEQTGPNVRLETDRENYYTPEVDEQVINYDKRTKLEEAKMVDAMKQEQNSKTFVPPHSLDSNPQYGKPEIDDNLKLHPQLPILSPYANDGQKFASESQEYLTIPNDANRQSLDREGIIVDLKQNNEYMPSINSEKPQNLENVHFESEKQTFGHYERPISKANTHDESKLEQTATNVRLETDRENYYTPEVDEQVINYDKRTKLEEAKMADAMEQVQNSKTFIPPHTFYSNSQYGKPEIDDNSKLHLQLPILNPYENDGQKFAPESQEYLTIPNDATRQSLDREGMIVDLKQNNEYLPSINSEKPQNLENFHFESEKQTFGHYERPISKSNTHDESKSEQTGPNVRLETDRGNYYTPEVDKQVINYDKRTKLEEANMGDAMEQVQNSKTFIPPHTFYSNSQYGKPEIDDNSKLHPRLPILNPYTNDGQKFAPKSQEYLTIPNDANIQSLDREGMIVDLKQNNEYMPSMNSEKPQNLENVHIESEKQTFGHYERPISKSTTHDESKSEQTGPNVRLETNRENYYTPEVDKHVINYDKRTKLEEVKMVDPMEQVQSSKTFIPPHTFYSNPQYGKPEIDDNSKLHSQLPILNPYENDGQKFAPESQEYLTIPNDATRQSLDREGIIVDLKQNHEYMPSINSEKPQNLEDAYYKSEKQTFEHYERPASNSKTYDESKLEQTGSNVRLETNRENYYTPENEQVLNYNSGHDQNLEHDNLNKHDGRGTADPALNPYIKNVYSENLSFRSRDLPSDVSAYYQKPNMNWSNLNHMTESETNENSKFKVATTDQPNLHGKTWKPLVNTGAEYGQSLEPIEVDLGIDSVTENLDLYTENILYLNPEKHIGAESNSFESDKPIGTHTKIYKNSKKYGPKDVNLKEHSAPHSRMDFDISPSSLGHSKKVESFAQQYIPESSVAKSNQENLTISLQDIANTHSYSLKSITEDNPKINVNGLEEGMEVSNKLRLDPAINKENNLNSTEISDDLINTSKSLHSNSITENQPIREEDMVKTSASRDKIQQKKEDTNLSEFQKSKEVISTTSPANELYHTMAAMQGFSSNEERLAGSDRKNVEISNPHGTKLMSLEETHSELNRDLLNGYSLKSTDDSSKNLKPPNPLEADLVAAEIPYHNSKIHDPNTSNVNFQQNMNTFHNFKQGHNFQMQDHQSVVRKNEDNLNAPDNMPNAYRQIQTSSMIPNNISPPGNENILDSSRPPGDLERMTNYEVYSHGHNLNNRLRDEQLYLWSLNNIVNNKDVLLLSPHLERSKLQQQKSAENKAKTTVTVYHPNTDDNHEQHGYGVPKRNGYEHGFQRLKQYIEYIQSNQNEKIQIHPNTFSHQKEISKQLPDNYKNPVNHKNLREFFRASEDGHYSDRVSSYMLHFPPNMAYGTRYRRAIRSWSDRKLGSIDVPKKRPFPIVSLILDPQMKLDMPRTMKNLGTATRNSLEDEKAPLFHLKNMLSSARNAAMATIMVPPHNILIPSRYKVVDKNALTEDGIVASETPGEDPSNSQTVFEKVGTLMRESIETGQEALQHATDVAHNARQAFVSTREFLPRMIIPYSRIPAVKKEKKVTLLTPRIADVIKEENPDYNHDGYVRVGAVLDALGISDPKRKDIGTAKFIIHPKVKKEPRLKSRFGEEGDKEGKEDPGYYIVNNHLEENDSDQEEVNEVIEIVHKVNEDADKQLLNDIFLSTVKDQLQDNKLRSNTLSPNNTNSEKVRSRLQVTKGMLQPQIGTLATPIEFDTSKDQRRRKKRTLPNNYNDIENAAFANFLAGYQIVSSINPEIYRTYFHQPLKVNHSGDVNLKEVQREIKYSNLLLMPPILGENPFDGISSKAVKPTLETSSIELLSNDSTRQEMLPKSNTQNHSFYG